MRDPQSARRRLLISNAEFLPNRFCELVCVRPYLLLVFAFNHDARQRLSSRIAKQETPATVELLLNFLCRSANGGQFFEGPLLGYPHVDQQLRITLKFSC